MPLKLSPAEPPTKVEKTKAEPAGFSFVTYASPLLKVVSYAPGVVGQSARRCSAGDVRAARGVDGQPAAAVEVAAAEVGGVDQGRAARVEFGQGHVEAAVGGRVERACRGGEVGRPGEAHGVGVARGVDRDPLTVVGQGAAEERGVCEG